MEAGGSGDQPHAGDVSDSASHSELLREAPMSQEGGGGSGVRGAVADEVLEVGSADEEEADGGERITPM